MRSERSTWQTHRHMPGVFNHHKTTRKIVKPQKQSWAQRHLPTFVAFFTTMMGAYNNG